MLIREGSDQVVIEVADEEHYLGSIELSVEVASSGYTGHGFAWVDGKELATFVTQLTSLEEHRRGSAELEGMSPGEFAFRIWSVDRRGHMAVGAE
jgi:hypothetical protein